MRVVTINGQNHKGSTFNIGRMLAVEKVYWEERGWLGKTRPWKA